jgi:hypothetical protein
MPGRDVGQQLVDDLLDGVGAPGPPEDHEVDVALGDADDGDTFVGRARDRPVPGERERPMGGERSLDLGVDVATRAAA